jgi:hypothetical protein
MKIIICFKIQSQKWPNGNHGEDLMSVHLSSKLLPQNNVGLSHRSTMTKTNEFHR